MNAVFGEVHPLFWLIAAILIAVDVSLLRRLSARWQQYTQSGRWPRLSVQADTVQLLRVVHEREGSPSSRQDYYEAVFDYRYQVAGRDYRKQTVQRVATRDQADALKAAARISFHYNPADPAQTLDVPPGPAVVIATLLGLLIFNSAMLGLLVNVQDFLAIGSD